MTITWTIDLNTGIDVIDNQHMRIVDYINQMEDAIARQDRQLIGHLLDELVDYTMSHFAFEESLQEEAGYGFAKPHKAIHDTFAKRVARYQERHAAGEDVARQIYEMLCTWLVHHIKRDDMAYVAEVKSNMNRLVEDKKPGSWIGRTLARFFK
ncbi:bacteriohemerythrin [Rhodocyclaceae bacterium]